MPAKNPRLTITLQPVIAAQLRRLAELTGNSQSALIAELLDGTSPVFDRVIRVLEAAQQAQNSIKGSLAHSLDDAPLPLLADLETVKRRSRRTPRRDLRERVAPGREVAEPTPMSNRGVRSDPSATKAIAHRSGAAKTKPAKQGAKTRGVA